MNGVSESVVIALMGSSVIVALITLLSSVITFKLNRKATIDDRKIAKSDKLLDLEDKVTDLSDRVIQLDTKIGDLSTNIDSYRIGLRMILHDNILRLANECIQNGKITMRDKSRLRSMHNVYHNDLGGNGDLNDIMDLVEDLELIIEQ